MRMDYTILRNSLLKVRPLPCSLTSRPRTFPPTTPFHPSTLSEGVVTNTAPFSSQSGLHFHLSPASIPTMFFSCIVIDYK